MAFVLAGTVERNAETIYLSILKENVFRTEEFSEDINVDFSKDNQILGIEILTFWNIPWDELIQEYKADERAKATLEFASKVIPLLIEQGDAFFSVLITG